MGKKRVGNAAAAAPEVAPKPLSHFAHALIPPFKSKDDLTKALKVREGATQAEKEANASYEKRERERPSCSSSAHDIKQSMKKNLLSLSQATADALSSAPQAPDGAVSLGQLAGALVDRALLLHKDKVRRQKED